MKTVMAIAGTLMGLFMTYETSACEVYEGDLYIFSDSDLSEAQKYCEVTGLLDVTLGEPRDLCFENLVSVGKYLSFSGNSLRRLSMPKLERVGWWLHISSKSYHQEYLEELAMPEFKEGVLQIAVTPNLKVFNYNPCSSVVLDDDTIPNLTKLGLLQECSH